MLKNCFKSLTGCTTDDYKEFVDDFERETNVYTVTGSHTSIISARVSYVYNLVGPAMTLDTACSSALVAIDVGSRAILSGNFYSTPAVRHRRIPTLDHYVPPHSSTVGTLTPLSFYRVE